MELVDAISLVLAIVLAFTAAIWDIRYRTIPNWLCLVTAICGLLFAAVPFDASELLMHAAHLLVALVIGMGLFALRWVICKLAIINSFRLSGAISRSRRASLLFILRN